MIKVIIFAVIGLVVGLGGGSGVAIMRAKKAADAVHDSSAVKGDSAVASAREPGDGAKSHEEPTAEHPATAAAAPVDSAAQLAHSPAAQPPTVPAPTTVAVKPAPTDTEGPKPATPGRISKIFGAMSAKDAARVLQQMDDADVQTVLSGLNDRQAAAILSGFPPERAAAISRATLRGQKGAS